MCVKLKKSNKENRKEHVNHGPSSFAMSDQKTNIYRLPELYEKGIVVLIDPLWDAEKCRNEIGEVLGKNSHNGGKPSSDNK